MWLIAAIPSSLHFMYAFPKISGVENLFLCRGGVSWRAATTIGVTLAQVAAVGRKSVSRQGV